jgi:hypothetical protein
MIRFICAIVLLSAPMWAEVAVATQTVTVVLQPQGKVAVPANLHLERGAQAFASYTGILPVAFRVRMAPGMTAIVTVQATAEFQPAGGPGLAAGDLTFTCGPASRGAGCSGLQTVSTVTQRSVVTLPCPASGNGCSSAAPGAVELNLSLVNDPRMPTETYTAPLLFTVSSL